MNRQLTTKEYVDARDAVTQRLTENVRHMAELADQWQQTQMPPTGKVHKGFSNHADHTQWLLTENFAAFGFRKPGSTEPIGSLAYLDSQYETFRELFLAQTQQIQQRSTTHANPKQGDVLNNTMRLHMNCVEDYRDFTLRGGVELSWEKANDAITARTELALRLMRNDIEFLTNARIMSPLPQPRKLEL